MNLERFETPALPGLPPGFRWRVERTGYHKNELTLFLEQEKSYTYGWFRKRTDKVWTQVERAEIDQYHFRDFSVGLKKQADSILKTRSDRMRQDNILESLVGVYESRKI